MSLRRLLFMLIFPYFLISAILSHRSVVFLRILHICAIPSLSAGIAQVNRIYPMILHLPFFILHFVVRALGAHVFFHRHLSNIRGFFRPLR